MVSLWELLHNPQTLVSEDATCAKKELALNQGRSPRWCKHSKIWFWRQVFYLHNRFTYCNRPSSLPFRCRFRCLLLRWCKTNLHHSIVLIWGISGIAAVVNPHLEPPQNLRAASPVAPKPPLVFSRQLSPSELSTVLKLRVGSQQGVMKTLHHFNGFNEKFTVGFDWNRFGPSHA